MATSQRLLYATLRDDVNVDELGCHLRELASMLKLPPLGVSIEPQALDKEDIARIQELKSPLSIPEVTCHVMDVLYDKYSIASCVLVCNKTHPFADVAREQGFAWGCANGSVAYAYGITDKYLIWHEALHLLGAVDCYNVEHPEEDPGPWCKLRNCIMQYEPTTQNVGGWPFICCENAKLIKDKCTRKKGMIA